MNEEISVLDKKVRLLQPEGGFRTGLDSVMLAAACPAAAGHRVLDMGCGVGGATFCLLHRVPDCHVTGIEIQSDYVALANQNIPLNDADGKAEFIYGDIRDYNVETPEQRFDHIICNPPYLEAGHHIPSPSEGLATARGHGNHGGNGNDNEELSLRNWVDAGLQLLKSGGSLTMIHRADATDRIICALGKRFGAIEIIPLWPRAGENAKRVVVRARKDRKSPAKIHTGLVLHDSDGSQSAVADKILREGKAIV